MIHQDSILAMKNTCKSIQYKGKVFSLLLKLLVIYVHLERIEKIKITGQFYKLIWNIRIGTN